MKITSKQLNISKAQSWRMFDKIAPRYDLLNHLLSFGLHVHWRKKLACYLPHRDTLRVLDLATGTADVLLSLCQDHPSIVQAVGLDLSENMMRIGRKKVHDRGLSDKITLRQGDAVRIPFDQASFDVVTISFGIRNVTDPLEALREMCRVLYPGGRALILEFSMPENIFIRTGHVFYLRTVVPLLGALVCGNYQAYKYLNQTIEQFAYGQEFCELMKQAGFRKVKANPLLLGVATIYQGEKC